MNFSFIKKHSLDKRKEESEKILLKYPTKIPVIVEKANHKNTPDINKNKFLVPKDLTLGQFLSIIRKRIDITEQEALYIFIGKILPPTSETMTKLYSEYKHEDNFLYLNYCIENTFGN